MSITVSDLTHGFAGRTLFENVTLSFNPGSRYGLTGPNGSGKSTFLKILMKQTEAVSGSVSLPARVGYLRQNIEDFQEKKVIDVVIQGNERLFNAFEERDRLYQDEITDEIGIRLAELEEIIAEEDGYSAQSNAEELLLGIGIAADYHEKPMGEIPTDLQFRALICQALFGNPEALLLDEPTNHLDLESIHWLEEFLAHFSGTVVVVSHDRHFLNAIATHIADIDYETIILYPGNYDAMVVAKSAAYGRASQEARMKEKKIAELKEFVARFSAGTRASQVQSRLKEIEKLQPDELKKSHIARPYIRFIAPTKTTPQIIAKVENIHKSYGDKKVINGFSIEIRRGDKIGIIGNNGVGKTTLIQMLARVATPDLGTVVFGHEVEASYFPQHHGDILPKESSMTLFEWLRSRKENSYDQDLRAVLGKLLFSGNDAFKKISSLSGGEKARLILGSIMLEERGLLFLDEATNHLDLEAVSALGSALADYKGTAIAISHDRDFLTRFASRIIAFESTQGKTSGEKKIVIFDGTLDEYFARKKE